MLIFLVYGVQMNVAGTERGLVYPSQQTCEQAKASLDSDGRWNRQVHSVCVKVYQ